MTILLALVGAILYRIRGGWLPTGSTQLARAIWCVPTAALVGLLTGNWIAALTAFFLAWAGLLLPNDPWQQMASRVHWLQAAGIGIARVLLLLASVAWADHTLAILLLGIAGALNAPLYWLGWRLPERAAGGMVDWHTAWGELFFGALAWGVLILAA